MTRDTLIDEIQEDRTHVRRTFNEIRQALEKASTREDLTELYKQSAYLILMTHSAPINEKDDEMKRRREMAEREFATTVHAINQQAKQIGTEPDFDEDWKNLATNGYQAESGKSLEPRDEVGIIRE